ncbi:phage tail spike protein [Aerococcus urinaeequi]|uniref:phage tail spike protein n=1 Tax=Aerococcus urinaeequi TaxID=51665 RepID=UPI00366F4B22
MAIIYIYDSTVTDFTYNGQPLNKAYEVVVDRTINDSFFVTFNHPLDDKGIYKTIEKDKIVKVHTPDGMQPFRVMDRVKYMDHISIEAWPLFYADMRNKLVKPLAIRGLSGQAAVSAFVNNLLIDTPFTFTSNITDAHDYHTQDTEERESNPNQLYNALDVFKDIVKRWQGELVINGYDVRVVNRLGKNTGALLYEKKNISDFTDEESIQDITTRLYGKSEWTERPQGSDEEVKHEISVKVESPLINAYSGIVFEKQYTNNDIHTEKEMTDWLNLKFTTENIDKPSRNIKVNTNIVDDTVINLGDSLVLKYVKHDVDMEIRMVGYTYDGYANRYITIQLGDAKQSYVGNVQNTVRDIETNVNNSVKQTVNQILNANGERMIYSVTEPVGNFKNGDVWFDQQGGMYFWDEEKGMWVDHPYNRNMNVVAGKVDDAAKKADEAVQAAKDANDLADKLAEDFDKLDISGVNLVLGSDTPKVLNDGETKYFWNLENPLSDYALKSGDKLTVSMYAELFSESEKFKNWSDSYYQFMEHNTKTTGNLAINDLGLVGGAFVPDNPLWSYTPPTTGTSEAQLLTIRGVLQQYLATNEKKWLDTAHFLTDALLNYYYPTPSIPSTPDSSWVPHWLVNVNAPFKSRRWDIDGEVNFVNGVGVANIPAIFRVWSARTADSTLEYLWAPDSPVIGTELEIESTDLKYKEDTGTIVLKDKTFTGKGLLVYTSWDGEIINVGDKCEAYPVWRPLEEGEIACAVDALPWALDVFQLWYEATGDEVWLQAVESTKASIVSASDVTNTEYFIKPGADGEKVLKDGVTAFSTRSPKETYTNQNGMIMIDYPQAIGEASLGTWVGDNRALNSRSWIEVKIGSDKKEKIQIVIDEFADYDPDKRWIADILLSGEGLTEDKHQYISLTNKDFYKADRVVWGSAYDKTTNVSAVASGNSSLTTKTDPTQLKNNHPVTQLNFKRGDEGGWLGWAQAMLGIWNYTFPFNMNYKTNDNLYFVVNDSEGVRWEYILPKTGEAFKTININADLFTSADGGKLSTENYQSMVIEAIDEEALLYIDYIGFVDYFNGSSFSNVSLTYKQPTALKLALSYIKPAPSRNPLDYTPYIMPFDYHYINYQLSDMRGAIYSGYQVPWIYQENVFKEADTALATNLRFLSDAQDAYQSAIGVDGFFAPIYWWNYRTDYGKNEPNSWGITGNWGPVWGGFQYRTISDVARVFRKAPDNKQAYDIFMRFLKGMDANWTSTVDGFPTAFVEDKAPYTDQKDSHMVSNFMRALLYGWESSRLTAADKTLIQKLLNKCYEYLDTLFNPIERFNNSVEGTWSPSPELDTWFNYWGGDILDGLAIARTSTAFNFGGETGQYSGELSLNTQNPAISLNTEPIKLTNMEYGKKYRFNSTITLNGNDVAVRFDKPKLGITLSNTSKLFSLVVNKIKVEAGSKPTAHTLALSETVDVMAFSRFEKTLNGFRTTVRNMKSDKTTVTQLANMWRTTTELVDGHTSQITSMGSDINLRVSKGDLLSQINIEAGNVLIESGTNKLNITPETTYIQDATIKSAMIESIEADKITTGTLDAAKVRVINIDADNITANKTNFIQSNWNNITSSVRIDGGGLLSTASDSSQVYLQNGIVGTRNPQGATIGQIGYAYQTESPWYTMQVSYGSHFQIRMNRGAGELNKQAFYIISGGTESYLNTDNIYLNPSSAGRVRVQGAMTVDNGLRVEGTALVRSKLEYLNGGLIESQSGTSNLLITASGKMIVYAAGTNAFEVDSGYMYLRRNLSMEGNNITNQSDIRLKTNIVDTSVDSLFAISNWHFKAFDRVNNGSHDDIGLIAQNTSEIVVYDEEKDIYNVNSSKQIMMNSHGIQQLNTKVDDEVSQLKAQIASLQDELALLKGE